MKSTLVRDWFGAQFGELHPLLQQLHTEGGRLAGEVQLEFGSGLAGWLGRRLAKRMGLPREPGRIPLEVTITHTPQVLVWARRFGAAHEMVSLFEPVGHWPGGHWRERTGALHFRLTVDVREGGWYWRVLGASLHGLPLPVALLPRSHAYKRIEGGAYRFEVAFIAPLLGRMLAYGGLLQLHAPPIAPGTPAGSPRPASHAGGTSA
jgi:hypothetical protein